MGTLLHPHSREHNGKQEMKIPGTRMPRSSASWLIALLAVFSIGHYLLPLSSAARLWWADSLSSVILEQVANGVAVRMGILYLMSGSN